MVARPRAFSFYPTKVVTGGEGGMIVTADDHDPRRGRVYRDQGKAGFLGGGHVQLGSAWRMSEVHAAVGLVHLGRLDESIAVRRRAAAVTTRASPRPELRPLAVPAGVPQQLLQVRRPARSRYRPGRLQAEAPGRPAACR